MISNVNNINSNDTNSNDNSNNDNNSESLLNELRTILEQQLPVLINIIT